MKLVFLDIDGVLNRWPKMFGLHEDLVANLKKILDETDAKIVVSSSWRLYLDEPNIGLGVEWRKVLAKMLGRDVGVFIGDTPDLYDFHPQKGRLDRRRGAEIDRWLLESKNKFNVSKYAVIDDEISDIIPVIGKSHIFKTEQSSGLTTDLANRVIEYLNA